MTNIPSVDPLYKQRRAITKKALRKIVYSYCCGVASQDKTTYNDVKEEAPQKYNEDQIIPEFLAVWQAFKKNGFDFYKFMLEKDFELIEDEEIRVEVLMGGCFPILNLPIARFMTDWLNGYLDFFKRDTDDITDTEVLRQLFFCNTEEDIWNLMANTGIDIACLYYWYKGEDFKPILKEATGIPCYCKKDEQKAHDFLEYLMSDSTNDSVRNEAINLKKKADNTDRLREISEEMNNLLAELNIDDTVFV